MYYFFTLRLGYFLYAIERSVRFASNKSYNQQKHSICMRKNLDLYPRKLADSLNYQMFYKYSGVRD